MAGPRDSHTAENSDEGVWDTGASRSVISQEIVKSLGLVATGATNVNHVNHVGGMSISPTHVVNFYLPNHVCFTGVLVTEFSAGPSFGAIIGMDVITMADLAITTVSGQTMMSFRTPSLVGIDYVAEHAKALHAATGRNDPCFCGSGQKFKRCHGK